VSFTETLIVSQVSCLLIVNAYDSYHPVSSYFVDIFSALCSCWSTDLELQNRRFGNSDLNSKLGV